MLENQLFRGIFEGNTGDQYRFLADVDTTLIPKSLCILKNGLPTTLQEKLAAMRQGERCSFECQITSQDISNGDGIIEIIGEIITG